MNPGQNKSAPNTMAFSLKSAILDNISMVAIILGVGSLLVVTLITLTHDPYYTVSSKLLFESKEPELVFNNNDRGFHSFEDWMRTQSHEIESNQVLLPAIQSYEDSGFIWIDEGETEKNSR